MCIFVLADLQVFKLNQKGEVELPEWQRSLNLPDCYKSGIPSTGASEFAGLISGPSAACPACGELLKCEIFNCTVNLVLLKKTYNFAYNFVSLLLCQRMLPSG